MKRPKYRRVYKDQTPRDGKRGPYRRVWQRIKYATFRADRYLLGVRPVREVAPEHRAVYRATILAAAKAAQSMGEVWICRSSYRTYSEQAALYELYKQGKGNLAARPGTSRHEKGNALDLGDPDNRDIGLSETRRRRLQAHGFIFAVPSEPWHVEHIG